MPSKSFPTLAALAVMVAFVVPPPAAAHVFAEAKLVINVLPGNTQTDAEIRDLVAGANRILGQCGNIQFSPEIKRLQAFPAGFDARGNTLLTDQVTDKEHLKAANPEIKNGGFKIFLALDIEDSTKTKINGATFTGKPVSEIAQREKPPRQVQGDSQTWAHEIAHGLGLSHVGDADNLMFRNRLRANGRPAGSALDEETQCKKIRSAFLKLAPTVEVTLDQLFVDPGTHGTFVAVTDDVAVDLKTGEVPASGDSAYLTVHGVEVHRVTSGLGDRLDLTLYLDGPLPARSEVDATFMVLFDTDGDAGTGLAVAGQPGIDAAVELTLEGRAPFDGLRGRLSAAGARLDPAAGWVYRGIPEVRWLPEFKEGAAAPDLEAAVLEVSLPTAVLGGLGRASASPGLPPATAAARPRRCRQRISASHARCSTREPWRSSPERR